MTIESPESRKKNNESVTESIEGIPYVDALAIIGHSIEEDKTRGWVPTRLVQKMDESQKRTGARDRGLKPNDDSAYVGGGNVVALAAAEAYNALLLKRMPPKVVSVVPGRPLYLERAPQEVNEGASMLEAFERKTNQHPDNLVTLGVAKNTAGELEEHLKMCVERGYRSIGFVLLDLRTPRAEALIDKLKAEHPEFSSLETHCLSAETLLRNRYKGNPARLASLEKIFAAFTASTAHRKTVVDEQGGTEAIRKGTYKGKGNY